MNPGVFRTSVALNVREKADSRELGTQVARGRFLKVIGQPVVVDKVELLEVQLCEDGYQGYLEAGDYLKDVLTPETFTPNRAFDRTEIAQAIPNVLAFLFAAMQTPNRYLWGGTLGPNFDCSGLVQAAFASQGIWLPRDSKDQCAFTASHPVADEQAEPGDLLFFSRGNHIDHVGIHLGSGFFMHSSSPALGRDGIGMDRLSEAGGRVAANYCPIYRSSQRVCSSWPAKT